MNWWQYLLLANVYLVLFYAFYALLLRRETFFQLNRVYLVSAALLSFFIPLIQANWVKNLFITQRVEYTFHSSPVVIRGLSSGEVSHINLGEIFVGLYVTGIVFLLIRFAVQLIILNRIIKDPGRSAAFSFFKKIKLDNDINNSDIITVHEQVHAKQWHSADVLIIEAVMIINWLNPVVYFYRRAIKHIHEFIADSHALKAANNKADYALLLLSQTFNAPSHQLVNHFFNHSLLKQRIIMLQKNKSQRIALIKYGLSAPLFILMLILSSATVNNSKAIKRVNVVAQKVFDLPADHSILSKIKTVNLNIRPSGLQETETSPTRKNNGRIAYTGAKIHSSLEIIQNTDTTAGNAVFTEVASEPTFPGGFSQFYKFLLNNLRYPDAMRQNKISGNVIISFIVEKDGSLSNIKSLKDIGYGSAEEAIRVMSLSPKWHPGSQNGKLVRVQYTVPVDFELSGDNMGVTVINVPTSADTSKKSVIVLDNSKGAQPIVVLDDKVVKNANLKTLVKPNDIYSIVVLKDKHATDLYGADAVNGVIVITTKKAKKQ